VIIVVVATNRGSIIAEAFPSFPRRHESIIGSNVFLNLLVLRGPRNVLFQSFPRPIDRAVLG
jgi:hypothetical protein